MNYKVFSLVVLFSLMSFTSANTAVSTHKSVLPITSKTESRFVEVYRSLHSNQYKLPDFESFTQAFKGFEVLKTKGAINKDILTLVDFSLSSNAKRLWIINMNTYEVIMNTYVAHGKNTGEEYAQSFSNADSSNKSSLGFYITGETYMGKHGLSLKLDGQEKGVNDNARRRGIVMHAADYVSETFIKTNKRLGRSQGCPAVPVELSAEIIDLIKDKSCLFIYHPSRS
ncbi:murein L,D-transpeptidase catalytic domain family protein [Flavobacterium sp. CYK-55]|uniref:murein L,D-transpeptidase catalytic domain family protein n=1 Tax=Flavobacterium sp. CYK-55 TaxID=2835529 RepID=UPI001BCE4E4C|nr:murein L,D-transpeptidase catalytic domain family protein [Flavobacterium sp. CYK-55]MBS7787330.1 murein L,D-transpeptidase catalytic domain family protein [Flavobacterium sp. CYK-55]